MCLFHLKWDCRYLVHLCSLTERKELRKRLQCETFGWYLDHVYPDLEWVV